MKSRLFSIITIALITISSVMAQEAPKVKEKKPPKTDHRDAGTGKYVTEGYANAHPKTTIKETKPPKPRKSKKKT